MRNNQQTINPVTKKELPDREIKIKDKEFLSIDEAAELMGLSRSSVLRSIYTKQLKAGKLGGRIIITRKAIDNLISKLTI